MAHRKFKNMFRESWVKFQDNTDMKFAQLTEICESLIGITKETIFDAFQFHPRDLSLYSELFSVINETTKTSVHHVYTTNYDRVVEEFCASRWGTHLIDGFKTDAYSRRMHWKFARAQNGNEVREALAAIWKRLDHRIAHILCQLFRSSGICGGY